jgi:lysocardiolipin and lysophospholipid acyltransferase
MVCTRFGGAGADGRFAPTPIIISGDESVKDEIRVTPDGRVETSFSERIVFIANHLVSSLVNGLFLTFRFMQTGYISGAFTSGAVFNGRWVSYTSNMHGAIYILLKDSLKWVPIVGWGMQFYGFSSSPLP